MDTKVKKKTESPKFIPNEIILIILSLLPAKIAMAFSLVCKNWRNLTSSDDFVQSHLENSIPTILVTKFRKPFGLDFFAFDNWWKLSGARLPIHRFSINSENFSHSTRALFSHSGLVAFLKAKYPKSQQTEFIILNPTKPHKQLSITLSKKLWVDSNLFGVYFHPLLKEYCTLWKIQESISHTRAVQESISHTRAVIYYMVLILGSNPYLKPVCNPFSKRMEKEDAPPLFINNYLYWMLESRQGSVYNGLNDIIAFDTVSEEFTVIPCPCHMECTRKQTDLLNIDGVLSFLLILPRKIVIWKLEDRAEQLWTTVEYTLSINAFRDLTDWEEFGGVAIVDGKLALLSNQRLLVCNLAEGIVNKYPKKKMYRDRVFFLSHQMSLASITHCKSAISIVAEGDDALDRAEADGDVTRIIF